MNKLIELGKASEETKGDYIVAEDSDPTKPAQQFLASF